MSIQKHTVTEPWLDVSCELGEGPLGDDETGILYFLDCVKCQIHTVDVSKGPSSHKVLKTFDHSIGSLAFVEGNPDLLIYGAQDHWGIINIHTGKSERIAELYNDEQKAQGLARDLRLNDGRVDRNGRYWAGSMQNKQGDWEPAGTLYRLDNDLKVNAVLDKATIPNGISWSDDDKKMLWTDTMTGSIFGFDYDAPIGNISNRRDFFHVDPSGFMTGTGGPDGHAMDEEDYLWVAMCPGSKIIRLSPKGETVAEVTFPTRWISCCAFIGTDLYVTSIAEPFPDAHPNSVPTGGRLFKFPAGVRGKKLNKFKFAGGAPTI